MAGAIIQTGSSVGENNIVNIRASVDHDCTIFVPPLAIERLSNEATTTHAKGGDPAHLRICAM